MIRNLFLAGWVIAIAVGSLLPSETYSVVKTVTVSSAPQSLLHLTCYAVLTILFMVSKFRIGQCSIDKSLIIICLQVFLFGVLIEVVQGIMVPGRDCQAEDMVMNTLGTVIGMGCYLMFNYLRSCVIKRESLNHGSSGSSGSSG